MLIIIGFSRNRVWSLVEGRHHSHSTLCLTWFFLHVAETGRSVAATELFFSSSKENL